MKVARVWYKRLFNMGNFEHQEIGIMVSPENGESPEDALARAREWVNAAHHFVGTTAVAKDSEGEIPEVDDGDVPF